ncbi:transcriptional transactivator protein [Eupatorium yellow vein virus-[MNS2]]|uniref:Transcriptional activator protein n=1 Tax=Eupatorium yellow vein virus-[MNS2] TaxID=223276 RepID=Q8B3L7_9GEMI|nr:transcriptional transactivator protein [Eupatorium yellow vein virus-[MNS2]]CAD27696.1 transcriptional transactivator protein [Eupatorium yellow vein virus-[MNS2]]
MQPSSPSTAHSIQVPIKVQHRIAKKKKNRRRRIDLGCGCSIFVGLDCANYGFTHRDHHYCSSGAEWRVYLDGSKSPIFQNHEPRSTIIQQGSGRDNNTDTVQPQPKIPAGFAQVFPHFQDLESLTSSDVAFLEGL